jgi:hypothetical protein
VSKHQREYDLANRPDLAELFAEYRRRLADNGAGASKTSAAYGFARYSNGERITPLARRIYAVRHEQFGGADPFDAGGPFYRWARARRLTAGRERNGGRGQGKSEVGKARYIEASFRLILRLVGPDRYKALMDYLSWLCVLRNQKNLFE